MLDLNPICRPEKHLFRTVECKLISTHVLLVVSLAGGGSRPGPAHHLLDARARHRLLQAVHEPRHLHHDQEAGEAEAGRLLLHGSPVQ